MIEVVPLPFLLLKVLHVVVHERRDVLELETAVSLQIIDSLLDKPDPEKIYLSIFKKLHFYLL